MIQALRNNHSLLKNEFTPMIRQNQLKLNSVDIFRKFLVDVLIEPLIDD